MALNRYLVSTFCPRDTGHLNDHVLTAASIVR
jgi:hypothetical protein